MAFSGMDPDRVNAVASALAAQANSLDQVAQTVDAMMRQAMDSWPGADAEQFFQWWTQHYRPRIVAAAQGIHGAVANLRMQVATQVATSDPTLGARASTPATATDSLGEDGTSVRDLLGLLAPVGWVSTSGDLAETWRDWKISELPGGGFLSSVLKGVGLGTSASALVDSIQHYDWAGGGSALVDGVATFAPAPISLLWTGLSSEVFFFIPADYEEQDDLLRWLREERGLSAEEISRRYEGWQGFITLGNDNAARKAPWLVDGADRLMQKPAEWLYEMGIRL